MISKKMFLYVFIVWISGISIFASGSSQTCAAQYGASPVPTSAYNFTVKNTTGVSVWLFADLCPIGTLRSNVPSGWGIPTSDNPTGTPSITASVAAGGSAQICSPCFSDLSNGNFGGYFMLSDGITQEFICIADYPTFATRNDAFEIVPNDSSSTNCPLSGSVSNQASGLPANADNSNAYIFKNCTKNAAGNCSPAPIVNCKTQNGITCSVCDTGYTLSNNTCAAAPAPVAAASPTTPAASTASTQPASATSTQPAAPTASATPATPAAPTTSTQPAPVITPVPIATPAQSTASTPDVPPAQPTTPTPAAIKPIVPVIVVPQPVKPKVIVTPTTTITVTNNVPSPIKKIQVVVSCAGVNGSPVIIPAYEKAVVSGPANVHCTSPRLVVNGIYGTYVDPTKKMSSAAESTKLVSITPQDVPIAAGHNNYTVSKKSISYTPGSGGIIFNIQ